MGSGGVVMSYVQACTSGALAASECGPIWHLVAIAGLILAATVTLLVMRVRAAATSK